jgi:hypothetical protein
MMKEAGVLEEQDSFEALGFMLAGAGIDPIVDTTVSPSGIAAMTHGEKPTESKSSTTRATGDTIDGWPNARMGYM